MDAENVNQKEQGTGVPRWVSFLSRYFMGVVSVLFLLTYGATYLEDCFGPPIRADGAGYYAYLPSLLIYGDPSFERLSEEQYDGRIEEWTGIERHPETGRYLDKYNAGVAIMLIPFFGAAHLLTWLMQSPPGAWEWLRFNYPLNGYSLFYQHAAGLGGMAYMLLGLFLLKKALECCFRTGVVLATLSVLVLGTNLYHYGAGETVLSHAFSFFLFAVLLHVVPRWYAAPARPSCTLGLGVLAGLIALVRVPNVLFLVFVSLYGVASASELRVRLGFLRRHWKSVVVAVLAALAVYAPQLLMNRYATGSWFVNAYGEQEEGFRFLHPQFLEVLAGVRTGLFFWSPVLLIAVPGLFLLRRRARVVWLPSLLYLGLNLYVIASWHMWWFGGGFGHRAFVESYVVLAFALASAYASLDTRSARILAGSVSVLAVLWSLFLMKLYYTREISFYGLDSQAFYDLLWVRGRALLCAVRAFF